MPLPTTTHNPETPVDKDLITHTIKKWIVTLDFKPGEKIVDTDIAAYFNISRTPVREVLKQLEQQKLIRTYPGRATVVAPLETERIEELYAPMCALQCLATRLAVEQATEGDIMELVERNEDFYVELLRPDRNGYALLMADKRFHDSVVALSRNSYIRDFCEVLWPHVSRLDYIFFRDTQQLQSSYEDHLELIRSMRLHDPFGAELAMKNNWSNSMLAVRVLMDQRASTQTDE